VSQRESELLAAIARFAAGEMLVVTDDFDRENEADLIMAAEFATPEQIGFIVRHTTGIICATMGQERARDLRLPLMVKNNRESKNTAFTVTVDYRVGMTTGVSATERANTLRAIANEEIGHQDFVRPGHVFPLIAKPGGLIQRRGHTEASIALCELAGTKPYGVLAELVNDDGQMMRGEDLVKFAAAHNLAVISVAELAELNQVRELQRDSAREISWARLPRADGDWLIAPFIGDTASEHAILKLGELVQDRPVLLRIHSECLTGDAFGSCRCDCGPQLNQALANISNEGQGLVIYLRDQEGRGIGLADKLRSYSLQDAGLDTVDANLELGWGADEREWTDAVEILRSLGINAVRLMTNNPEKAEALLTAGISVALEPLQVAATIHSERYLKTKRDRMSHQITNL
jgi:3,4-dihydroxy 2-butanone 4-phosphate synthase/GTP cyclohydrolase II